MHCTQLQHCGNAGASNEILTIKCISRFNCCFANVNAAGICSPGQERRQHLLPYAVAVVVVAGAAAAAGLLIAADQVEAEAAIDFQHTFTLHAKGASSNRNSLRCVRVYTVCVCAVDVWVCVCTRQCVNFKLLTKMVEFLLPLESMCQLVRIRSILFGAQRRL